MQRHICTRLPPGKNIDHKSWGIWGSTLHFLNSHSWGNMSHRLPNFMRWICIFFLYIFIDWPLSLTHSSHGRVLLTNHTPATPTEMSEMHNLSATPLKSADVAQKLHRFLPVVSIFQSIQYCQPQQGVGLTFCQGGWTNFSDLHGKTKAVQILNLSTSKTSKYPQNSKHGKDDGAKHHVYWNGGSNWVKRNLQKLKLEDLARWLMILACSPQVPVAWLWLKMRISHIGFGGNATHV